MIFDIGKMLLAEVYDHPVKDLKLMETHISWVVLTGDYAYKIKKPVNFGFLDFSSLDKRRHFCEQEVRLNRRLTSGIYLGVVAISAEQGGLRLGGSEVLEYAVKMKQFPQSAQLDNMLTAGNLQPAQLDALARLVAEFHQQAVIADESVEFGRAKQVQQPVAENFRQLAEQLDSTAYANTLNALEEWSLSEFIRLQAVLTQRKKDGFVRECHGDMHLANLLWLEPDASSAGGPMAFDCIEFNEQLRWIDVISEVAFLVMDLQHRNQRLLAQRFLNSYLEVSGDYAGLQLLLYYLSYRALVRAKVNALRLNQADASVEESNQARHEVDSYLDLALGYTRREKPRLMIMRGVSASGKSSVSQQLLEQLGAIRIRSDVERKRLFNINPDTHAASAVGSGLYTKKGSELTYEKLEQLAGQILVAGYSVIVDAAFLKQPQRQRFSRLAEKLGFAYVILQTIAPAEVLRQRILSREQGPSDANLDVLEYQLAHWQALDSDESGQAITLDTSQRLDLPAVIRQIQQR